MKKKVSFVQVNFQQGPRELNAYYLPYSAGVLLAHAFSNTDVQAHWSIDQLIWRRDSIEDTAQLLQHNDVVAFSTYVWNRQYNYTLGRRIKELNPQCVIVIGGPEPAVADPELFVKNPWMDLVVKMEGEIVFQQILLNHNNDYSRIAGLLINNNTQVVDTGDAERINDLDQIPSPYLTGIFDQIIQDHPEVTWNATLETNRGCPYACTFCDWGSLTYNKVKKFNLSRVFHELDWIGEHCGFVTVTDANFGMFVERDNMIADKLIEVQKQWNRLTNFSITWAKNQKNEVVDIVRKLINESPTAGQGLTVSVQSMDNQVLDNIKRRNLDQHKIDEIFSLCDRHNIPVYTEIILGLPGDTVTTWKENFWKLFRAGNHTGINILHAQLLENAEMNLLQRKLWQLESVPIYDYMSGSYSNGEIDEFMEVVVSTRDISRDEMLDTMVWNSFIQTFHVNGLTTYIARYLEKSHGIDYPEFYNGLYDFLNQDPGFSQEFKQTRIYYQDWITHGRVKNAPIGTIEIPGWNLHNRMTLQIHYDRRIDSVYQSVEQYIDKFYSVACLAELMTFQRTALIDHAELAQYPRQLSFSHDFLGHIQYGTELNNPCTYLFDTNEDPTMSLQMFLENFYFGRKRNFGKANITKLN